MSLSSHSVSYFCSYVLGGSQSYAVMSSGGFMSGNAPVVISEAGDVRMSSAMNVLFIMFKYSWCS